MKFYWAILLLFATQAFAQSFIMDELRNAQAKISFRQDIKKIRGRSNRFITTALELTSKINAKGEKIKPTGVFKREMALRYMIAKSEHDLKNAQNMAVSHLIPGTLKSISDDLAKVKTLVNQRKYQEAADHIRSRRVDYGL